MLPAFIKGIKVQGTQFLLTLQTSVTALQGLLARRSNLSLCVSHRRCTRISGCLSTQIYCDSTITVNYILLSPSGKSCKCNYSMNDRCLKDWKTICTCPGTLQSGDFSTQR